MFPEKYYKAIALYNLYRMNRLFRLVFLFLAFTASPGSLSARTNNTFSGYEVTPKGAWCWFADPRALHHENAAGTIKNAYIGYIDVHGNIKATQQNFITGKSTEVLIRSYFQPDDHDNPTFLILPDDRVMFFYSRHTDESCFYYRISQKPGDITSLGKEKKLVTSHNTTYPSPFILSDDPNNIYLAWRGLNWHPTIARLSMPDSNDDVAFNRGPFQIVQSTGARPYAKYASNGKDKIYLTYTTGHPDNESPNYIYFNYIDINNFQLKDIKGNTLGTIGSGIHNVNKSTYPTSYPFAMVDMPSSERDWVWQTAIGTDGLPVIAMVRISSDKNTHNYYYAKWTGTEWKKTFLANGGGKFHQTSGLELCYSGGMTLDDNDPRFVYCSVPVTGTYGTVYEIFKYTMSPEGNLLSSEAITTNSKLNNSRPYVIQNSGNSPLKLAWMYGNYYDWIVSSTRPLGYPTAIHCNYELNAGTVNLTEGLLRNEDFSGSISGNATTSNGVLVTSTDTYATFNVSANADFSVSLTPYLYEGTYSGVIFSTDKFSYGVNAGTQKPYVKIGNNTFESQNLLGTSDVWQTQSRGTGGIWYTPTKHKYFNLTVTYENGILRTYRNGLIDQTIEMTGLTPATINVGGFTGWTEDCRIYNRALNQAEVRKLTETSLAYTFNQALLADIELLALTVPAHIYTDVVLPTKTSSGATISWISNNTNVLLSSGLVKFPGSATQVTLTATIATKSKQFTCTVFPRDIHQNKVLVYRFAGSDLFTSDNQKFVTDHSGNENHARIMGNAQVNGTLDLTANTATTFSTNGHAIAPAGVLQNLRSYTFLLKIKPSALTSQPRVYDFGSGSGNSILLRASAFSAGFKYNGGSTALINASGTIPVNAETQLAVSFDATTKTTRIYSNGSQVGTGTNITYEPWQLYAIAPDNRNYIGRTQWWDSSVAADNIDFKGTIDNFMLYNIALTPEEIVQLQQANTSVGTIEKKTFNISPNPANRNSDICIRPANNAKSQLDIFNLQGKLMASHAIEGEKNLSAGAFSPGLYLLRLSEANGNTSFARLILQ